MALFGGARDISLFRNINYELLGDIISQQIVYYKHNISKTKTNIYGETTGHRFFNEPVKSGPAQGVRVNYTQFVKAKTMIYQENNWSDKAVPQNGTAVALEFARLLSVVNTQIR